MMLQILSDLFNLFNVFLLDIAASVFLFQILSDLFNLFNEGWEASREGYSNSFINSLVPLQPLQPKLTFDEVHYRVVANPLGPLQPLQPNDDLFVGNFTG